MGIVKIVNVGMADFDVLFPDNRINGDTKLKQAQLVMLRMLKIIDFICRKHDLQYWLCAGTLLGAVRHEGFIPWDDDLDICMMRKDYRKFIEIASREFPDDIFLQTRETDPLYDYLPLPCKVRDKKSLIVAEGMIEKKYHQGLFVDIFPADYFHKKGLIACWEKTLRGYFRFITRCLDAELGKDRSVVSRILSYFNPIFKSLTITYLNKIEKKIEKNLSLVENRIISYGFDTPWLCYYDYNDILPLKEIKFEDGYFFAPANPDAYLTLRYGDYMTLPPINQRIQTHAVILEPIL